MRAEHTPNLLFLRDGFAPAERFDLTVRKQHDRIVMAERPRGGNAE